MSVDRSRLSGGYEDLHRLTSTKTQQFPGSPPLADYQTDPVSTPPHRAADTEQIMPVSVDHFAGSGATTNFASTSVYDPARTHAHETGTFDDGIVRSVGNDHDDDRGRGDSRRSRRRSLWIGLITAGLVVAALTGVAVGAMWIQTRDDSTTVDAQGDQGENVTIADQEASEGTDPDGADDPDAQSETTELMVETDEPVSDVARAVGPAVVLIENQLGQGSGIVYDSGLIVTNAHVVEGSTDVTVVLASGYRLEGRVVGADAVRDVAVVSFETDQEYGIATLAPQATVEVGQLAVAIGSPFGLDQTVTSGIVSAIGRPIPGIESYVQMIQTDAPINPGNSGGALADREGRVIGMNSSIRTDGYSQSNAGVGFAIPSDTFKIIADRLVAGEPLDSGYLGVYVDNTVMGQPGALVSEVSVGTPAEAAGLQAGDLIVAFNGEAVTHSSDLVAKVQLALPSTEVILDVIRQDERIEIPVVLGSAN